MPISQNFPIRLSPYIKDKGPYERYVRYNLSNKSRFIFIEKYDNKFLIGSVGTRINTMNYHSTFISFNMAKIYLDHHLINNNYILLSDEEYQKYLLLQ